MYKTVTLSADHVMAVGDLHGCLNSLTHVVKYYDISDTVIFCCGDIGLGFEKPEADKKQLNHLNKVLGKHGVHAVMLRGNHDDKRRFEDGFYAKSWEFVHVVPDYTVVYINGVKSPAFHKTALCIGGAISIDRTRRQSIDAAALSKYLRWHPNTTVESANLPAHYWSDEPVVYDSVLLEEVVNNNESLDIVCTHTAPSFCPPLTKGCIQDWLAQDATLDADIANERAQMSHIYEYLIQAGRIPRYWVYGHFHFRNFMEHGGTLFHLVDMVNDRTNLPDWVELRFDDNQDSYQPAIE